MNDMTRGGDDDLLGELGEALTSAGPLAPSLAAGRRAWQLRTALSGLDVASLRLDSYVDETAGARAAGTAEPRVLTFTTDGDFGLELTVQQNRLIGQVLPPKEGQISVTCSAGQTATVQCDVLGCFVIAQPHEVFRLAFRPAAEGAAFATEWLHL